jgi:hypothetical protein
VRNTTNKLKKGEMIGSGNRPSSPRVGGRKKSVPNSFKQETPISSKQDKAGRNEKPCLQGYPEERRMRQTLSHYVSRSAKDEHQKTKHTEFFMMSIFEWSVVFHNFMQMLLDI